MEEFFSSHLLLSESEFQSEVSSNTAALAVDTTTQKIVYATAEAERLFQCAVKNGLNGVAFEELIPPKFREKHRLHFARYIENPRPRAMGDSVARLQAQSLGGETFPVAITLLPVKKLDRLYVILIMLPLPMPNAQ